MAFNYYIYYRVEVSEVPLLASTLDALFTIVHATQGVTGRVLKRTDDPWTWMEVYENVPDRDDFEQLLDELEVDFSLERFLAHGSRRHRECFEG